MTWGVLPKPPRFLTLEEVLSLHESAIDAHGGSYGIRDQGLLESALAQAQQGFSGEYAHQVPFGMAAAYLFHICKNHPFFDGNKRTSLTTCVVFLQFNGWNFVAREEDAVRVVLDVATDVVNKEQLAEWLMAHSRPRPSLEVRDFFRELQYNVLASTFGAIGAGSPDERAATISDAARAIPCIDEANIAALHAEENGHSATAGILRQHAMLLTAFYRIAEDMGYEW